MGVPAIRALLIENTDTQWAHNLREAACHPILDRFQESLSPVLVHDQRGADQAHRGR